MTLGRDPRRAGVELVRIIVGVLRALAVDRWMANLDAREQESACLSQLLAAS